MPVSKLKDRPTSVYIIAAGDHVKIGVSVDPEQRLRGLTTGTAFKPVLYHARQFPDNVTAFAVEKMMHRKFWQRRENGEWFALSPKTARIALTRMKPPLRHEMEAKGGTGWKYPCRAEIQDALSRVFGSVLGDQDRLDI